jgi:hypothetical protein
MRQWPYSGLAIIPPIRHTYGMAQKESPSNKDLEYIAFETPDTQLVPLSDGTLFPESVSLHVYVQEEDQPSVVAQLSLEVKDGRPVVMRVAITRLVHGQHGPEQVELTPTILHNLNFGKIFERAIMHGGYVALDSDGSLDGHAAAKSAAARAAALARRRQPLTDALLAQVVNIVRKNRYDPRKQVASEHYVSERTASRWIAEARRRGLIDEYPT